MTQQPRLRDAEAGRLERRPMVPLPEELVPSYLFSTAGPVPGALVYSVCQDGQLTRSSL